MPDVSASRYTAGESSTGPPSSSKVGLASRQPFQRATTASVDEHLPGSNPRAHGKQNGWGEVGGAGKVVVGENGNGVSSSSGTGSYANGAGSDSLQASSSATNGQAGTSNRRPSVGQSHLPQHSSSQRRGSAGSSQRPPSPAGRPSWSLAGLQDQLLGSSSAGFIAQVKFVLLCSLWYMSSAISSNTGKAIFNLFKFPITLTIVQFWFIALYCYVWTRPQLGQGVLREPSRALFKGVLPMVAFQIGGHVFSSVATSRVPVSTVHTIKALSPLFTVLSYRFLFGVSYTSSTYVALVPLTLGVMFACSFDVSASNVFGLVCAFGSTLVFVSSNIFFKKIVPSTVGAAAGAKDGQAATSGRLDKINLLFYSSSMAFAFMIPLWVYSDFFPILADSSRRSIAGAEPRTRRVLYYLFLNGTSHFAQNVLAFTILSSTSPVTYSIASLVKRIVVILMAIVWFGQSVHPVQALGIALTFVGLYMYQNAKGEVEKMEKKVRKIEAIREGSFLPTTKGDSKLMSGGANSISPFGTMWQADGYTTPIRQPSPPRSSVYEAGGKLNHIHHVNPPPPPRNHVPNGIAT